MLYREIIAVCSQIHTKQINTCVVKGRIVHVGGACGARSYHCSVTVKEPAELRALCWCQELKRAVSSLTLEGT